MVFILFLFGCSNDGVDKEADTDNVEEAESVKDEPENNEVVSINKASKNNIEKADEETTTQESIKEDIDPFWETYEGVELADAVSSGEKEYNFEVEAPLFEDALIESLSKEEDKDWTPYLTSFNANIVDQAPPGYVQEMNQAHLAVLEGTLDLEQAIEHVKEAKKIREESSEN